MKSYQPLKVVRDKNNSSSMNYVMHPDAKEQVSHLINLTLIVHYP